MTIQGTVNKTGLLLLFCCGHCGVDLGLAHSETPNAAVPWMLGGLVGGLVVALVTIFKKEWSPISAPIYALARRAGPCGISAIFDKSYPGIAMQAISLTFGVTFVMLLAVQVPHRAGDARVQAGRDCGDGRHRDRLPHQHVMSLFFPHADVVSLRRHATGNRDQSCSW